MSNEVKACNKNVIVREGDSCQPFISFLTTNTTRSKAYRRMSISQMFFMRPAIVKPNDTCFAFILCVHIAVSVTLSLSLFHHFFVRHVYRYYAWYIYFLKPKSICYSAIRLFKSNVFNQLPKSRVMFSPNYPETE